MGENINIRRLDCCQVSPFFYRFNNSLAVDHDYLCSQFLGSLCCPWNSPRWEVGEFNTGNGDNTPMFSGYETILANLVDYSLQRA